MIKVPFLSMLQRPTAMLRCWGLTLWVFLATPLATAGECDGYLCRYSLNIDQAGFYVITAALPQESQEGMFSLSLVPVTGKLVGTVHSGSVLKEHSEGPGFGAFYLSCSQTMEVVVHDYEGNLDRVLFRLLDADRNLVFTTTNEIGQVFQTPMLTGQRFYIAEVLSEPDQNRGRIGLSMKGEDSAACGFEGGFHVGGWLDDFTGDSPEGFAATWLDAGTYELLAHFGQHFGSAGSSRPDLAIRFLNDSAEYEPFWSSPAVVKINMDGTIGRNSVLSADGWVAAYEVVVSAGESPWGWQPWQLALHDLAQDTVDLVLEAPGTDDFETIKDLQISDSGSHLAYATSTTYPWPPGPKLTSFAVYAYDSYTRTRALVRTLRTYNDSYLDMAMAGNEDALFLGISPYGEAWQSTIELYELIMGDFDVVDLWGLSPSQLSISRDGSLIAFSDQSSEQGYRIKVLSITDTPA